MNSAYIASIVNSTLRSTTPILLAALGCAICSRVGVFNIALEAQMLIACFCSIVVNYYTGSVILSVLAGIISGALVGAVVAVLQVKYKAPDHGHRHLAEPAYQRFDHLPFVHDL